MTQPSRTTETINRDNAAIRDLMQQIRELTVPDRATLALGLVGHLATMMNRAQMKKLVAQLQEEAERVQDVPPNRQRADDAVADPPADAAEPAEGGRAEGSRAAGGGRAAEGGRAVKADRADRKDSRMAAERQRPTESRKRHGDVMAEQMGDGSDARRDAEVSRERADGSRQGVGQAGRGEFRSGRLL